LRSSTSSAGSVRRRARRTSLTNTRHVIRGSPGTRVPTRPCIPVAAGTIGRHSTAGTAARIRRGGAMSSRLRTRKGREPVPSPGCGLALEHPGEAAGPYVAAEGDDAFARRRAYLYESVNITRARRHVERLQGLYMGRCQLCCYDPRNRYGHRCARAPFDGHACAHDLLDVREAAWPWCRRPPARSSPSPPRCGPRDVDRVVARHVLGGVHDHVAPEPHRRPDGEIHSFCATYSRRMSAWTVPESVWRSWRAPPRARRTWTAGSRPSG
jgi:hypothetical protein